MSEPHSCRAKVLPWRPASKAKKGAYSPSLDGIRAFAVAGVLLYHLRMLPYPGGVFGVDIFFVLSGFLITGLLLREWEQGSSISCRGFYYRRARRLVPALLFMLAGFLLAWVALQRSPWKAVVESASALSGLFNWFRLYKIGPYQNLTHLWSLSIEFQFCLLWPLFCVLVLRKWKRVEALALACLGVFILVTLYRTGLIFAGASWRRVYLGTDVRLDAFALGGLVRAILNGKSAAASRIQRVIIPWAGMIGIAGVGLHAVLAFDTSLREHMGNPLLAPLVVLSCMAIIIGIGARPDGWFSRFFALPPFPQIGLASYGMYLWHYPLLHFLPKHFLLGGWRNIFVLCVSLVLGSISYLLIEKRFMLRGKPKKEAMPIGFGASLPLRTERISDSETMNAG